MTEYLPKNTTKKATEIKGKTTDHKICAPNLGSTAAPQYGQTTHPTRKGNILLFSISP